MRSTKPETYMSEAVAAYWARVTPGSRVIRVGEGYMVESSQTYQTPSYVRKICYGANDKSYISLDRHWYRL